MHTYENILTAFLLIQTASAVSTQGFDSKIGCQINQKMNLVSGLTGSVYYYPWYYYNISANCGYQDKNTYLTKAYLSGGYRG